MAQGLNHVRHVHWAGTRQSCCAYPLMATDDSSETWQINGRFSRHPLSNDYRLISRGST